MDIGTCPKLHAEEWKIKYDESDDKYRFDSVLEQELMSYISDADKKSSNNWLFIALNLSSYSNSILIR